MVFMISNVNRSVSSYIPLDRRLVTLLRLTYVITKVLLANTSKQYAHPVWFVPATPKISNKGSYLRLHMTIKVDSLSDEALTRFVGCLARHSVRTGGFGLLLYQHSPAS